MDIPDYLSEDPDNRGTYRAFDRSQFQYLKKFYFGDCIEVDSDYVMDDSIINERGDNTTAISELEPLEISQGKTAVGYDYVSYTCSSPDSSFNSGVLYYMLTYIRVTDEAVISLTYKCDSSESHEIMNNILESIKVNTTEE